MEYILNLNDREADNIKCEKIMGYKLLNRLNKYKTYGFKAPPNIPTPFFIIPQHTFSKDDEKILEMLEEKLFTAYEAEELVIFRAATYPSRLSLPKAFVNISKKDWKMNLENYISSMKNYIEYESEVEEVCGYFHPYVQPDELKASAEVMTNIKKDGTCSIVVVYGSGYTLERSGDEYIVDVKERKIKDKLILPDKKVMLKQVGEKVLSFEVPQELWDLPVLSDEEVIKLADDYSVLEKILEKPVGVHWTRKRDDEEYSIDFRIRRYIQPSLWMKPGKVLKTVVLKPEMSKIEKIPPENTYFYIPENLRNNLPFVYRISRSLPEFAMAGGIGGKTSHYGIILEANGKTYLRADLEGFEELKDGEEVVIMAGGVVKRIREKN